MTDSYATKATRGHHYRSWRTQKCQLLTAPSRSWPGCPQLPQYSTQLEKQQDTGGRYNDDRYLQAHDVGPAQAIFTAAVKSPPGVSVTVKPTTLKFTEIMQKKSFTVVVEAKSDQMGSRKMASGSIVWRSEKHLVRSPVVVYYSPESFPEH